MKNKFINAEVVYNFLAFPITSFKIIKNYLFPGTIVLIYHRVFNTEIDPQLLCVSLENFEKQMRYLKRNFELLRVSELLKNLKEKKVFQKGIVITFDDGYQDNYEFALPILEELKIPVTFFVCNGGIDKNEESWSHQLEQIFSLNQNLPPKLDFEFRGKRYASDTSNVESIKNTYLKLHELIKPLNKTGEEEIMTLLFKWAGSEKKTREYYRTLSSEELQKMANSQLVEIGGHTQNHAYLSSLSKEEQKREIEENKANLEKIINKKIIAFSYPYGRKRDYNQDTIEIVKENYQIAFSNFRGIIRENSNLYELPRFLIRNWDIDNFKRKIRNFFISS